MAELEADCSGQSRVGPQPSRYQTAIILEREIGHAEFGPPTKVREFLLELLILSNDE